MDKKEIESYIKKLQELEKEILNDDTDDTSIMSDLNKWYQKSSWGTS